MEERFRIKDNIVIWKGDNGLWAIIIMPEHIKIDNWHGSPHIHTNGEKKEISIKNPYKVLLKLNIHINRENNVILNKLIDELR